jgi:hypothetical protein
MNYTKQTWADGTTGGTPLSAARLNNMEAGIASANTTLNVKDYGAVGDGTADDTAAFQAAINAAATINGTVIIPNPPTGGYYKLTSTVTIKPQGSDTQTWVELRGGGKNGTIRWAGAANTPVFQCYGWKRGGADNIRIDISGAAGVIAWDVDTTVTYGSLSGVSWTRCFVEMGTTAGVGWRVGHVSGGIADISFCEWRNCTVNGNSGGTVTAGSRGWLIEGINTLNNYWFGGSAAFIDKAVSNSGATTGNDSMFFYGFGTTHTLTDFTFDAPGAYVISGGRFEDGQRFLDVLGPSSNHPAVVVQGVNISGHTPSDGILVNFSRPGSLLWDGNFIKSSGSSYTAAAFTFDGFTGLGTFHVRGGGIQAGDPFWTIVPGASWQVWTEGVGLLNSSRQSVTRVATRLGDVTPGDPNPANRYIPANLAWYVNPVTEDVRTLTPTLNSLVLHLFHSGAEGVTIDKLDAFVNTVGGAGAVLRAGLYRLSDQSRPFLSTTSPWATLLVDAGTVNTATGTGQKVWTLATAQVIPANTWFAVGGVDQVGTAANRTVGGSAGTLMGTKLGATGSGSYGTGSPGIAFITTGITGALPASLTAMSVTNVDSGVGIHRSA